MLACGILTNAQQMTTTITGSTVKFTIRVDGTPPLDWDSTPVSLYAYIDATDTTPNISSTLELLGNFGGTQLVNDGSGNYSTSVDLSSFPQLVGKRVDNIKFIYNREQSPGSGTYYQNPSTGGFSTNDVAHTKGWSPITVSVLGVSDLSAAKKSSFVANGKLYTKLAGNLDVTVYDMTGKIVTKSQVKSSDSALNLNVSQRGTYIVKVSNGQQTETVKFIK